MQEVRWGEGWVASACGGGSSWRKISNTREKRRRRQKKKETFFKRNRQDSMSLYIRLGMWSWVFVCTVFALPLSLSRATHATQWRLKLYYVMTVGWVIWGICFGTCSLGRQNLVVLIWKILIIQTKLTAVLKSSFCIYRNLKIEKIKMQNKNKH